MEFSKQYLSRTRTFQVHFQPSSRNIRFRHWHSSNIQHVYESHSYPSHRHFVTGAPLNMIKVKLSLQPSQNATQSQCTLNVKYVSRKKHVLSCVISHKERWIDENSGIPMYRYRKSNERKFFFQALSKLNRSATTNTRTSSPNLSNNRSHSQALPINH